jgi:hypothetical protein
MTQPTAYEQYMLELVNCARLDFDAEIIRIGLTATIDEDGDGDIDYQDTLNYGRQKYITDYGKDPNTVEILTNGSRQVLAFNSLLTDAARSHTQWMFDTDIFSHNETNSSVSSYTGTYFWERIIAAGYSYSAAGENIAFQGTTGTPNVLSFVQSSHRGLFTSFGHRVNIMNNTYRELGIGIGEGVFTSNGLNYNSVLTTQNFGKSGSSIFLTGVAFDDSVIDDDFYSIGEGLSGIQIEATRQSDYQTFTTTTMDAGGYQIALGAGTYEVEFSKNGTKIGETQTVSIGSQNVKLDLDTSNIVEPSTITIGEIGTISNFNHLSQTIQFNHTYINPVVFASPLSRNGADPSIVRITDIQSDSFTAYLQEAEYKDGRHTTESFNYIVLEAGTWQLADGTILEVGTLDTNATTVSGWETIDFSGNFQDTPVILSQVQTKNGGQFVRTRQKQSNSNDFQLSLEEEEALKYSGHATETVGWLAIESGAGTWDGFDYQASHTGDEVTHKWHNLSLEENFSNTPYLFASLASYDGGDPSGLRYRNNNSQLQIMIEEDQSLDSEVNHTTEIVDFFAISGLGELTAIAYDSSVI